MKNINNSTVDAFVSVGGGLFAFWVSLIFFILYAIEVGNLDLAKTKCYVDERGYLTPSGGTDVQWYALMVMKVGLGVYSAHLVSMITAFGSTCNGILSIINFFVQILCGIAMFVQLLVLLNVRYNG